METGIKCVKEEIVTEELTAEVLGSGGLAVYATPAMIRLMEHAAWSAAEDYMEDGYTTVGTLMNVKHLSASPAGTAVRAECELIETDGRRLVFKVAAYDDAGQIGEGTHERFIVQADKFLDKANNKYD